MRLFARLGLGLFVVVVIIIIIKALFHLFTVAILTSTWALDWHRMDLGWAELFIPKRQLLYLQKHTKTSVFWIFLS